MAFYPNYPPTTNVVGYYDSRSGWKNDMKRSQRYLPVTSYYRIVNHAVSQKEPQSVSDHNSWFGARSFNSNSHRHAYNKAYEGFVGLLKSDTVALGNAIGEWRSSVSMIARRAMMLRTAWKRVRALDPFGAIEALAVPPDTAYKMRSELVRKGHVRRGRKRGHMRVQRHKYVSYEHYLSSMWLELHFGFVPLMGDIHDSIKVLSNPVHNPTRVSYAGSNHRVVSQSGYYTARGNAVDRCRIFANVRVDNPNLALAERMGLVNPLAIAWELTPFSFVVDWFTNVGQIVESITDLAGLSLEASGRTQKTHGSGSLVASSGGTVYQRMSLETFEMKRSPGISTPKLAFRNPLGQWKRAATQISLLVQLFIKPR